MPTNISNLMNKMIVQLSAEEFCALTRYAVEGVMESPTNQPRRQAIGVVPLASELGCSPSLIYALKAKGVLDEAIISHIGKKAVFDIDLARALASEYQKAKREAR